MGAGAGLDLVIGEGLGVGPDVGAGVGIGEGVGVTCCDTFQTHVCIPVPFSLYASADTFHVPTIALIFV